MVHISSSTTSKKALDMLVDMYEFQDVNTRLYMRTKKFQTKKTKSKNMVEHINQFNTLLEQLAAIGSTIQDADAVITLLGSLPESSKSLVISLSMHPKLTLRKVASILLQEETRRKDLGLIAKKPIALFSTNKKNNFRRKIDDVQQ